LESFEQKAQDVFAEIVLNKSFIHKAGFGSFAIPTYVREWIISHYIDQENELSASAKEKISRFVSKYMHRKSEKEVLKNQLYEQNEVQILDDFSVFVNLDKGDRYLSIPLLDESAAFVTPTIVQDNEMLLSSGLWGVGTLFYIPKSDENPKGQIWMREFQPFQMPKLDIDYFKESRSAFTTGEWINLIVSSMGFNHALYSKRQKVLLIARLIPLVEARYNLAELAPKGTGKSFVYENISRYIAVRSGAITPAVLFFNDAKKTAGLITRYDCVVIDEAQKIKPDTSGELTALLKSYLEAGKFGRGTASSIAAEAGLVILANIDLDKNKRPLNEEIGLFNSFPNFFRESAFIDRFSGLLPGWELPKISKKTPSESIGLKGDIFGEILHSLRGDISYRNFVKDNMDIENLDYIRDSRAIEAGATGLFKILFPDQKVEEEEFYEFCVNPALELRQRIRDELTKFDREFEVISMKSKYPDFFQINHILPVFYDPDLENDDQKRARSFKEKADDGKFDVLDLIRQGENTNLEFKSSLQWDFMQDAINKNLRKSCLKTIVAFLNSNGGTLLIGVNNQGEILGLEKDLDSVGNSTDQFLNLLNTLIVDSIGSEYSLSVNTMVEQIKTKEICVVRVKHSLIPAYYKGDKGEEFYIRFGTTTRLLNTEEAVKYISQNWK